ncbi:MAG TPA: hypothetical protein VLB76_10070 [Thermoanaerobaculia bacterium]|nr:hypothetical protein [Thermoanaerobaculia bacterium]
MRYTASLVLLSLFSACVPASVIRINPLYVSNNPLHREVGVDPIPNDPKTSIVYVELDDMGDLWDDSQIRKAEEVIRTANICSSGAIVVTYVHGWHQNADSTKTTETSNLQMFKRILGWMAYEESVDAGLKRSRRPVVGVYIGWRGITGYWPADYYNRHKAAGRVAGPAATEVLLRVTTEARRNPRTRSIVVGHSMGGLIVERSLIPALDAYLLSLKGAGLRSQCDIEKARQNLPMDLIVLVNPASHAIEAHKFIGTLRRLQVELKAPEQPKGLEAEPEYYKFFSDRKAWPLPLIVSLTSEGDSATRVGLNLAAYPMALNKAFREYEYEETVYPYKKYTLHQRDLSLHTAGNFAPLASHWVRHAQLMSPRCLQGSNEMYKEAATVKPCPYFSGWKSDRWPHRPEDEIPGTEEYRTMCFESRDQCGGDSFWFLQKPPSLNAVVISQEGQENISQSSPYWIMHIPKTVVEEHAKIFTFPLERLLRGLLRISGATGTVPASCESSEAPVQGTSLNPNAIQTIVREPRYCEPPPDVRLIYEGLQSGCKASKFPCFLGELFRFHLEEVGSGTPYQAKACEAIQWNFADGSPLEFGSSVEHLFPANLKQAGVEIKSSSANVRITINVPPEFRYGSVPTISYHGESSKCSKNGVSCWLGETIRFDVVEPLDMKASWSFEDEKKEGVSIEHRFTSTGTHRVHLGIEGGGGTTAEVLVETRCVLPDDKVEIRYTGEISGCDAGGSGCIADEAISFSLANLPAGTDESCFKVDWSYGDGAKGSGLNTSHLYRAAETFTVSASIRSADSTLTPATRLVLRCPPPRPVALDYFGEESGCSRATVSKGSLLCKLNEPIAFSIIQESYVLNCGNIQWSFLKSDASAERQVKHTFPEPVPSVSVSIDGADKRVSDIAPILFEPRWGHPAKASLCAPIDRVSISYVGDKNCNRRKQCSPGERIKFSILPTEGVWTECPGDRILWLFDDGAEPQSGATAAKAFRRSKPPHAVHLVVLRNGKVTTASTTVDIPLLSCKLCLGTK